MAVKKKADFVSYSILHPARFTHVIGGCWQLYSKNTANLACLRPAPTGHGKKVRQRIGQRAGDSFPHFTSTGKRAAALV
jgi:hypothetical protein